VGGMNSKLQNLQVFQQPAKEWVCEPRLRCFGERVMSGKKSV
jgi:hypothetical protein